MSAEADCKHDSGYGVEEENNWERRYIEIAWKDLSLLI